ncbi:MAG: hypothetical protein H0T57_16900 [Rubrobacter sp.]|nr:hypothetical protein [Rubrobacter sp.]
MDIHIYRLTKCGFYARGEEEPEFGYIGEWWDHFEEWVAEKEDVSLTATFNRPEEVPRRLYCADTVRDEHGNFGVALWNEAPAYRGNVAYLPLDGRVGQVQARTTRFPTGSIAGWPTYLWFLPRRSLVVALSPEDFGGYRGSGIRQAREYFHSYLGSRSRYARYRTLEEYETQSNDLITGYCLPHEEEPDAGLRPRFETRPLYGPGPLQEILNGYRDIRKIVKSYNIEVSLSNPPSRIERALDLFMAQPRDVGFEEREEVDRRRFRIESTWHPSKEAVLREIEEWESRDPADNYWVGVYFDGDSQIRRFDKEKGKVSVELNSNIADQPLWMGEELISAWTTARNEVEGFLRSFEDEQEVS